MLLRFSSTFLLFVISVFSVFAQSGLLDLSVEKFQQIKAREKWVDSIFNAMTDEERIAQLFMVAAYSNRDEAHKQEISKLITDYKVGGLIFFQGNPAKHAMLCNHYQSISKVPMLVSIDGEWGLGMRLDSTLSYPRQLTLGAIEDEDQVYKMGKQIAEQCKRIGIHINFAPVVDVNSNPLNPVINNRSFGEDKLQVSLKGLAYMEGLQDHGVMACAKHFPGHGDTDSDSHLTLPVINHNRKRLNDIELYPFKVLINNGLQSVMAAHIHVPALDNTANIATSLSPKVTTDLLKKEIGFDGLVFSDALNMKGVSKFYEPGEVDLRAYLAGNDVLLFAEDVPRAIRLFKEAIATRKIDPKDLYVSVKKILHAKFNAGLNDYQPIEIHELTKDLNQPKYQLLVQQLYEQAMTLARNTNNRIPIQRLDTLNIATLSIGASSKTEFQSSVDLYAPADHFQLSYTDSWEKRNRILSQLKDYNLVLLSLHDMSKYASREYGINTATRDFIKQVSGQNQTILTVFGSPYSLKFFEEQQNILQAYEDKEPAQLAAAEALFGGIPITGKLPVTASDAFTVGSGLESTNVIRFKYSYPEEVGIPSDGLGEIDNLVAEVLEDEATPGCQILVAKEGKVIYYKSFGYHTYDKRTPVKNSDIYDLASITKVAATTISLMQLYDQRLFQLNRPFSNYLPGLDSASIKNLIVKNVLTHTSGLKSWIPFYQVTISDTIFGKAYHPTYSDEYPFHVAKNLYMNKRYRDTIFNTIYYEELNRPNYQYSDLGFYLFREIVEEITKTPFQNFTSNHFYKPLGLSTMTFNPLLKFNNSRIVPTEDDQIFRKQLVHGYVHDPGAAMLGGVSGHAGLFSNANDLAILMQMLLNRGVYGGTRFLNPTTISLFTKKQTPKSRRGLGFDKPELDIYKPQPTGKDASPRSFGHSGFTGTCVWVDPDEELIYVFLSNRVYPDAGNSKLVKNNVRTDIHQLIYDAIKAGKDSQAGSKASVN